MSWPDPFPKALLSRRSALAVIGLGLSAPTVDADAAEVHLADWTSHELRLPKREGAEKPPIVTALAIANDGDNVAIAGDDHLLRIWSVSQHRFLAEVDVHHDWVRSVAYSPDNTLLASAGNDGRLVVWDVATETTRTEFGQPLPVTRIAFGPEGAYLAAVGFRSPLRFFDLESGQQIRTLACPCADMRAVAASPDNRHLAAGGRNGKIRVWDMHTGREIHNYRAHQQRIRAIEFSADSLSLASCSDDRTVRVSRLDGEQAIVLRCPAKVMSLAFCGPQEIAAGATDNTVRVWDLATKVQTSRLVGHTGSVTALAYAEETLASAGYDTVVRIWSRNRKIARDVEASPRRVGHQTRRLRSR